MAAEGYPRDLVGYGAHPPDPHWPNEARIAVSIVLNYEEGGEYSVLHGDDHAEFNLTDVGVQEPLRGARHLNVESAFEYGSRVGFWEITRLLLAQQVDATVYAVGLALERNPEAAAAIAGSGFEVACHGQRWIDYHSVPEAVERADMLRNIETITRMIGRRPVGWYTGRQSPNTRRLVVDIGGFLYDSDAYNDELPYYADVGGHRHLVVPYTMDVNDSKFANPAGFGSGGDFLQYLKDSFDCLYREGATRPGMMSVGLHMRLAGRPGRAEALRAFLGYVSGFEDVWICRRIEIARHWADHCQG